jgi:hypothetical protein
LYTREVQPAPEYPVKDGVPHFGTYSGPFTFFDIRGMNRPFGDMPLPLILTDLRIMETLRFVFCDTDTIGEIELFDGRYFTFMEAIIWNRKTGQKNDYRRLFPPRTIRFPRSFGYSTMSCRSRSRYVRILTRLQKKLIHVDYDFLGSGDRPPSHGRLEMNLADKGFADMSCVIPYGVKRRCLASYQAVAPLHGWLGTAYQDHQVQKEEALGFFDVRKAYFGLRTKISKLIGLARIDGRVVSFQLGNSVYHDDYTYNDNVLFLDGQAWPLPPVKVTRPYGVEGNWFIQDTESMVDLVFTPVSDMPRKLSAFVLRTDYHTVYGTFEGTLLAGNGEKVSLRAFPGIGKKILLRI